MLMCALGDEHHRVSAAAIEALAVVHHHIGDDIRGLLADAGATQSVQLMLGGRFASKELPTLKSDGAVEHEVTHVCHQAVVSSVYSLSPQLLVPKSISLCLAVT